MILRLKNTVVQNYALAHSIQSVQDGRIIKNTEDMGKYYPMQFFNLKKYIFVPMGQQSLGTVKYTINTSHLLCNDY